MEINIPLLLGFRSFRKLQIDDDKVQNVEPGLIKLRDICMDTKRCSAGYDRIYAPWLVWIKQAAAGKCLNNSIMWNLSLVFHPAFSPLKIHSKQISLEKYRLQSKCRLKIWEYQKVYAMSGQLSAHKHYACFYLISASRKGPFRSHYHLGATLLTA